MAAFFEYPEKPAVNIFVNLHEDLYQLHELAEHDLEHMDMSGNDMSVLLSFDAFYKMAKDNEKELGQTLLLICWMMPNSLAMIVQSRFILP